MFFLGLWLLMWECPSLFLSSVVSVFEVRSSVWVVFLVGGLVLHTPGGGSGS